MPLDYSSCANCWEVEHRLVDYLSTKRNRQFVRDALHQAVKRMMIKEIRERVKAKAKKSNV